MELSARGVDHAKNDLDFGRYLKKVAPIPFAGGRVIWRRIINFYNENHLIFMGDTSRTYVRNTGFAFWELGSNLRLTEKKLTIFNDTLFEILLGGLAEAKAILHVLNCRNFSNV
jgi:hypothetical protein